MPTSPDDGLSRARPTQSLVQWSQLLNSGSATPRFTRNQTFSRSTILACRRMRNPQCCMALQTSGSCFDSQSMVSTLAHGQLVDWKWHLRRYCVLDNSRLPRLRRYCPLGKTCLPRAAERLTIRQGPLATMVLHAQQVHGRVPLCGVL
jgi:hypothetical protein